MVNLDMPKLRLLVLIVAYYAERTIEKVVHRIPRTLLDLYDVEILIIDDGSRDATFAEGVGVAQQVDLSFKVTVLYNPINQGYVSTIGRSARCSSRTTASC
jgi:glycosyltransferase involved in cell wall biosynthesis